MSTNPAHIALQDIKEDLLERDIPIWNKIPGSHVEHEVWAVFGKYLYNKDQRMLNKQLGLHKINMFENQNAKGSIHKHSQN